VRLVAIPEGALQGFNDEVLDLDHETFARECAIDIPGPETDELGALARKWDVFVMAQAKARHPRSSRTASSTSASSRPRRRGRAAHHKLVPLLPVEHSVTPHNVYDRWVELYGATLDAFYPGGRHRDRPARDHDGQRGLLSRERARPGHERRRGRLPRLVPAPARSDAFVVQSRARALDNNFYVIAPNVGTYYLTRGRDADRHLRRALADRRLPRPRRRRARLQRRVLLGRGHDRHPRAAPLPRQRRSGATG
jgi:hypothetical protein